MGRTSVYWGQNLGTYRVSNGFNRKTLFQLEKLAVKKDRVEISVVALRKLIKATNSRLCKRVQAIYLTWSKYSFQHVDNWLFLFLGAVVALGWCRKGVSYTRLRHIDSK